MCAGVNKHTSCWRLFGLYLGVLHECAKTKTMWTKSHVNTKRNCGQAVLWWQVVWPVESISNSFGWFLSPISLHVFWSAFCKPGCVCYSYNALHGIVWTRRFHSSHFEPELLFRSIFDICTIVLVGVNVTAFQITTCFGVFELCCAWHLCGFLYVRGNCGVGGPLNFTSGWRS